MSAPGYRIRWWPSPRRSRRRSSPRSCRSPFSPCWSGWRPKSDYGDIAKVLGKSEVACRQIVSRARRRVKAERPRVQVSPAAGARLVEGFIQAIRTQDRDAMLKLLAQDVTWTSDGGGKAKAALKVLSGAPKVARFAVGVYRKAVDRVEFRPVMVNGEPGVATIFEGKIFAVMALRTDGRRILDVYAVLNPEKLKGIPVPSC
jgi:RNA polymerase sigma-70 factor, ECF subfamily